MKFHSSNILHTSRNVTESFHFVLFYIHQYYLGSSLALKGAAPGLHLDASRIYCKMLFTFAVFHRLISFS